MRSGNLYSNLLNAKKTVKGRSLMRTLLVASALMFSVQSMAQTYFSVTNLSGTVAVGGVNVTVTSTGSASTYSCGGFEQPYYEGGGSAGSYTWSFSSPVSKIRMHVGALDPGETMQFFVNGVAYTLTGANLSNFAPKCFSAVSNGVASGGILTNPGGTVAASLIDINPGVAINSFTASFPSGGFSGTTHDFLFAAASISFDNGSPQSLTACKNSAPVSLNSMLAASNGSGTYTWSVTSAPTNGTLSGFPYSIAGGTGTTPTGTSYQPNIGYSGSDAFTIQVSDGTNTASTTINVTVNNTPDVTVFSSSATNPCQGSGSTVTINSTSLAAGTYTVAYHTVGTNSITSTGIVTMAANTGNFLTGALANSGLTTIILDNITNVLGCPSTLSSGNVDGITVLASPSSIFVPGAVCETATMSVTDGTSGGTFSIANPAIATVGATVLGTATVTGVLAGTTTIVYTLPSTCSVSAPITVNPQPAAIVGATSVCTGSTTTFTESVGGGTWSSSNGAVASVSVGGVVSGVAAGTATITYTLPAGCYVVKGITVNQTPPGITGTTFLVCTGLTINLADGTSGGTWTSSDNTLATVTGGGGVVTGVAAGTPTITYTVPNTCFVTHGVTVNTQPSAISGSNNVCVGQTTTLSDLTPLGSWTSSNNALATVSGGGVVTGVAAGSPTITYTVPNGCFAMLPMTVNPNPVAITGPTFTVCTGNNITLSDATGSGTWSSSNSGLASVVPGTGVVTGNSAGVPTISYTLVTGCYATAPVSVNQTPVATTGTNQVCVGGTQTLINTTPGGTWASSDNSKATVGVGTGVVSGVAVGTVTISYVMPTGCYALFPMTVNAVPAAITGGTFVVCEGSNITLADASGPGTWSSSNTGLATVGSVSGVVTGVAQGIPTITFTVTSTGCIATAPVTVNQTPTAITGTTNVCVGSTTALSTTPAGGTWTSSAPAVGTVNPVTGVVSGLTVGTTNIVYTLGTGCFNSTTVSVNPNPAAITGTASACVGFTSTLADTDPLGVWTTSDGTKATVGAGTGTVTGIAAGNATITYTLPTGCIATKPFTVNPNPSAITGTLSVCAGLTTALADATSGGTWTSSNGAVATIGTSGIVTGVAFGTSNITYTLPTTCYAAAVVTVNSNPVPIGGATNVCVGFDANVTDGTGGGNWSSSNTLIATVGSGTGVVHGVSNGVVTLTYTLPATGCYAVAPFTVNITPAAITGTTNVCIGSTTALADATPGGTWSSSNNLMATVGTGGVVTGVAVGTPNISYTIASTGCYAFTPVTVNPLPLSVTGVNNVCVGLSTSLSDATLGGTWTSSDVTKATVGAGTGLVTGVAAGAITITYTLPTGCIATMPFTVNPLPAALTGTFNVCTGFTTTLSDATPGGSWTSSNTLLATVAGGVVTGVSAGVPTITYTLPTGCIATQAVTVNTTPPAITGTASVCVGLTTALFNANPGGTWSSADVAKATVGAGTGIVTGVASGTVNITYTMGTGCYAFVPVTVNANPAALTGTTNVCVGLTTTLASATPGGTWSSSNIAEATVAAGVVTGVTAGVPTITYTIPATGCITTTAVTVNANPTAITGTASVCTGSTTTLGSTPSGGTWTSSDISKATVGTGTGVVTGVAVGNPNITYTLGTGCIIVKNITVNQTPVAIAGTMRVCVGLTTTLTDATVGGNWSSSDITKATVVVGTGVVTGVASGVPIISYTIPATGCFATAPVTVNPNPAAITGLNAVCTGATIGLADATVGGTWSSSDVTKATVGAGTGVVTGVAAGTPTITYTLPTGCIATYAITVNTTPLAITGTTTVCTGFTTTLADGTPGGTWSSSNVAEATVGAGTGIVTGVTAGTPTISYTMGTGCFATTSVTVNPTPPATTGTPQVCVGLTTTLANTLPGGTWSSTNLAQATVGAGTGIVTGVAAGNPTISYTMATGCYVLTPITVNPTPAAITGTMVVCASSNTTLNDATSGGVWSSGNVAIATVGAGTGVVTGVAAGNVGITYTLGAGCFASTVVTVNPQPNITNFTSPSATSQCVGNGATVTVNSTSLGSGSFTVTYNLSGANAVTGATAVLTMGPTNGTFTIPSGSLPGTGFTTVTITGISNGFGCTSSVISSNTATFSVYPLPTVYNVIGGGGYCSGGTGVHIFLSNSVGGVNYQLFLGASPVGSPLAGTFSGLDFGLITTAGTYTVVATNATTGCTANMSGSATVFINPLPTTQTVTGGGSYCAGGAGVVVGLAGSQTTTNYQLYVGASPTGSPVGGTGGAITFGLQTAAGTYTVVATNTSTLCTNNMTGSVTVTINPLPAAITGTLTVCPGTTSTLSDATSGGTWTSSTPAVATIGSSTGVVTGVTPGTAIMTYTLGTGCTVTTTVTVNSNPASIAGPTTVCVGAVMTLTDATGGGTWSSSNTGLATVGLGTGIVTGVASGSPTITYTLATGCLAVYPITVNPVPASITGSTGVCVGLTTTLANAVSGGTWTSSTPANATIGAGTGLVTGVAAGTTTITYTLPAGCNTTFAMTVNPTPLAITGTTNVCTGFTTTLADATTGGTWTSSNGAIATVSVGTGVVTGVTAGTVTITYTLPAGCFTTTPFTVNPTPAVITGLSQVCAGLTITLSDATSGGTWTSSTPAVATVVAGTGVVTGVAAGTTTITYTLPAGCNVTFSVTVNPNPLAITGTNNVCVGSTTTLADATTGGTWTSSNVALATVGAGTGVVTGVAAGTPTITYTLPTGCVITTPVTVNPLPVAITGITTVCVGSNVTLSDASSGGTWTSSNVALATVGAGTGVVTGVGAGNPTITYTLPTGCLTTQAITVNPTPAAITGATFVCVGQTTTLSDGTIGGTWTSSNPGLATVGAGTGLVTGIAVGVPTITYTLPAGCTAVYAISVNPLPVAITGTTNVCAGFTTALADATGGGTWTSSNVAIATVGAGTGVVTGVSAGTVSITYTLPGGCIATTAFTVNPQPVAITGTNNVCLGLTTTLTDLTVGGTWSSSAPATATVGAGTGIVTGIAAGNLTITYTLPAGCFVTMPFTVNPLPAGITGVPVVCVNATTTLSDASAGGTWTSGTPAIATIGAGTGVVTGISAGTLTFTYTLPTGCLTTIGGTVNPLPTIYTVTGGGSYCAGGTGVVVGLSNSQVGVNYQLFIGASPTGSPVAGTGSAISFGLQTANGTYTVVATNATTGCVNNMSGTATVTINLLPTVFNVTGGGNYCSGGAGVTIGINGSQIGVNYQVYLLGSPVGSLVAGTGSAIPVLGTFFTAGNYTVLATNAVTACTNNMAGVAVVVVNPLPTVFTVSGGGSYCTGGTGVHIFLSGSTSGVNYTCTNGVFSATLAGTGSALDFGFFTSAGTYTITATNATTGCVSTMLGTATVSINVLPTAFAVNGGGAYCAGGTGIAVGLANSQLGVNYQLFVGGSPTGSPVAGTGLAIGFGLQVTAGTYTVVATNATTGCTANMTGSVVVSTNPLPTVFTVTGGGSYCVGGTGVLIGLSGSTSGISYSLFRGVTSVATVVGAGTSFNFPLQTVAGTYTVVATNTVTTCTNTMAGSVIVNINPLPLQYSVTGGGTYCAGGTGVHVFLSGSDLGINYQLYLGLSAVGTPVAGTGLALDFGLLTTPGTYTVVATNVLTGCTNTMLSNALISTNPLPTVYNVTGGGSYCAGGPGVHVFLSNSTVGVTYQLFVGGVAIGSPVLGTGGILDFGFQTAAGTYTVVGTNLATLCTNNMAGSPAITINPLPTVNTVTGGGSYCAGGAGVTIGLDGSVSGINYQLYNGVTLVGSPIPGTGSPLSFGSFTTAGTYTVVAISATTGCTSNMTGSAVITVNPLPAVYNVTGGGAYCIGGTGLHVGLSNSDLGISYQLYNGVTAVGGPVAGTGAAIDFGVFTGAGTYTAIATNTTTSCINNMSGSVVISINPLPAVYTVTGGGSYCPGGSGVVIGLSGSALGFNYQLYRGASPVGAPVAGTSIAIGFGLQTGLGTYSVVAINATTGCTNTMTGTAIVTLYTLPTAYTVTGGGGYCVGGTGAVVGLSNSAVGVNYQLYMGVTAVGIPVPGTGAALSFGLQTGVGTFTVVATSTITGCSNTMTGSVNVSLNPLPTAYTVTGGGGYCAGGTGVHVILNGSNTGISYQLYRGILPVGPALAGTGVAIDFGLFTTAGTYTVKATNATTGCVNNMTGSATVTINPLPIVYLVTGGGAYCAGGTGVSVGLAVSDVGISYQLYRGLVAVGAPVAGTGLALDFGLQTVAGTYTVVATDPLTGCVSNMSSSATVNINALPVVYGMTGGGAYCAGGSGMLVGLNGSNTGINYQLYNGITAVGGPAAGTGFALSFGLQTAAGTYTVIATDAATGCVMNMSGTSVVTINPLPNVDTVTGGGNFCPGGSGVHVGLSGSTAGISYQLFRGVVPVGAPMIGTGSALDYGLQVIPGAYFVVATNTTTGCTNNMIGSPTVGIYSLPTAFTVTLSSSSYCTGGTGVDVMLSGSQIGTLYQLFRGVVPVGAPLPGTGFLLHFGLQTSAGTYSVVATSTITGCTNNMTGTPSISINPLPTAYTVTGGGNYCAGGTGVHVLLSGSDIGVNYQLFNGSTPVGSPMGGTGYSLDFGLETAAGGYTVVATNTSTGCTNNMMSSAVVIVNPLPIAYYVVGGGSYCAGGTGVAVGLNNSESGLSYQLYVGMSVAGSPVVSTGGAINFGLQTTPGVYTVVATNIATGCTANMLSSATINTTPLPTAFSITGGGNYCIGGTGVHIGISGSSTGITYQLMNGLGTVGGPVAGTGSAIDFGLQTVASTYMVVATNTTTGCTANMTGSTIVTVSALPIVYTVTGGGSYCESTLGAPVGISSSDIGINYQLYNGMSTVGGLVAGTGSPLSFGLHPAGTYTVVAIDATTTCSSNMGGSVTVTMTPSVTPGVTITTGVGDTVCAGTSVTFTALTVNGGTAPTFQWSVNSTPVGTGSSYTYVPTNGNIVSVVMTSNETCVMPATASDAVTMTVKPNITPVVTIAANPGSTVCQGTIVDLTATPTDGGSAPTYSWVLNGHTVSAGSVYSYVPTDGDIIFCQMNSSYACVLAHTVLSNNLTLHVDDNTPPVVILLATNKGTKGDVRFYAIVTNGGPSPTYQWSINGLSVPGATNDTFITPMSSLHLGDMISVVVTKTNACGPLAGTDIVVDTFSTVSVKPVVVVSSDIKLVPNPNKGIFTIKGTLGTNVDEEVSIEVTDILGQVIYTEKVTARHGELNEKIQLSNTIANGMYMLNLRSSTENKVFHIVVEQ
jgi:uncharacterized protein YjdB